MTGAQQRLTCRLIEDLPPTPREIAFRLLAAYHGGSTNVADVFNEISITVDDLASIVVELVQIAGVTTVMLARELDLSHDELTRTIEGALEKLEGGPA